MSSGWVAGNVRAATMAHRRLGAVAIHTLAHSTTLADALEIVAHSPYGREVPFDSGLAEAERGVATTLLWNLRVLAGWLPAQGAEMVRLLAGWFEVANIDEHLRGFVRPEEAVDPPFRLGTLATAWPRLSATSSVAQVRSVLAGSAWGDPGEETPSAISLWLRLSWADRVTARIPLARAWAAGAVALLAARELFVRQRRPAATARAVLTRLLGSGWSEATDVANLHGRLPAPAAWALADVTDPDQLWAAEARWWARLRADGQALLARSGFSSRRPLGAMVLLAADAWQVCAALEVAARGGADKEALDAVA